MNSAQNLLVKKLNDTLPQNGGVFKRSEVEEVAARMIERGLIRFTDKHTIYRHGTKVKHGVYTFDASAAEAADPVHVAEPVAPVAAPVAQTTVNSNTLTANLMNEVFVPAKAAEYVKWGHAKDIESIIKSKMFFPTYVAGLSGNGKTFMIEQSCAKLKREYVRVQMTPETDEDDLIGGFRLIDGNTVFVEGPVIKAMRAGAILLIDEIDRASNRLMAIQGVLEGKPVLVKKTHEVVSPAPGFNIIATANTHGQGSESGNYSAANIIDEALLERFSVVINQTDPTPAIESRILKNRIMNHTGKADLSDKLELMVDTLTRWAVTVRKSFEEGAIENTISTRRLIHIINTFLIFGDVNKAIEMCTNRFDESTRIALVDLYEKHVAITADDSLNDGIQNHGTDGDIGSIHDSLIEDLATY